MANSRNSILLNKPSPSPQAVFQRALEAILARVVVSDRIAIAYSGGLDSSVLLHMAAQTCQQHGIRVFAFHIHHGLSSHADRWLAHCEKQAHQAGAAFASRRIHVAHNNRLGIEQAARLARYAALRELCHGNGVTLLLSAHHQDDQAETVLLQLLRGAGLPGLSAMPELQTDHALLGEGVALGRPLLDLSRSALAGYARAHDIPFVEDESNDDTRFRRNDLRHRLMPLLEQTLPGTGQAIARSTRHLQSAQRLLNEIATTDLQLCCIDDALLIDRLRLLSDVRADNLLRHWLKQRGAEKYPSEAQLAQLRGQMLSARRDAHPMLLFGDLRLERHRDRLTATRVTRQCDPSPGEILVPWRGESEIAISAWQGHLVFAPTTGPGLDPERLLRGPLRLRPRSGGERLKLHPGRPSRTLKNLFQEAQVPASARQWLPLLYLGDELVFVAGLGMDVRAPTSSTGICLRWQSDA